MKKRKKKENVKNDGTDGHVRIKKTTDDEDERDYDENEDEEHKDGDDEDDDGDGEDDEDEEDLGGDSFAARAPRLELRQCLQAGGRGGGGN